MNLEQAKAKGAKILRQYEAGRAYDRRIGFSRHAKENERFYHGEQWSSAPPGNLPAPVFNMVKRIGDYLCGAVCEAPLSVQFTDEALPLRPDTPDTAQICEGLELLNRLVAYRFEKCRMDALLRQGVQDALLCGDTVFYTYWDPTVRTGQEYAGDFVTRVIDSADLYVADVSCRDLQAQAYLLLAGRETVSELRQDAYRHGTKEEVVRLICADSEGSDEGVEKATCFVQFFRRSDGCISYIKSVKQAALYQVDTPLRRYPVAQFCWESVRHSYHGVSPVTGMIANQKYLNKAYAMVMKHMADTAFSKVIYDKKLIPEWTNEVGQAIGVLGGNVENAVKTVGVGEMQPEYLELIRMTSEQMRLLYGATDTALGESIPQNNSALLAMRDASRLPLQQVKMRLYQCVEDLACIWAEMICAYYGDGRAVPYREGKVLRQRRFDFSRLKDTLLSAKVEVAQVDRFDTVTLVELLSKLLEGGHITFAQYLSRLPEGVLPGRQALLEELAQATSNKQEE